MKRNFALLTMVVLAGALAAADEPKKHTEGELLAELKKLAAPPTKKDVRDLDPDEVRELLKERARTALKIVEELETRFPSSEALAQARSETLQAVGSVDDEEVARSASKVARALREGAARGSDHAAQADLFLIGQDFRKALHRVKSVEEFQEAWKKHADELRKAAEGYMAAYPHYRPGADAVAMLVRLAQVAHDDKAEHFFAALIAKHQPEHPLARTAVRMKTVGKEFDFEYTPLGAEKPAHLKDLRGKVVVVYFWAVWCLPCKAETKRLMELYEKHHGEGLEVVAVSLDEKEELVPRYVKVKKVPWPQWVGPAARKFAADWGVDHLPTQFVIDRHGRLHNANAIGTLEEQLPGLLKE
jgi:thiol-disulfide isomerase/thioredoxin